MSGVSPCPYPALWPVKGQQPHRGHNAQILVRLTKRKQEAQAAHREAQHWRTLSGPKQMTRVQYGPVPTERDHEVCLRFQQRLVLFLRNDEGRVGWVVVCRVGFGDQVERWVVCRQVPWVSAM